MAAEERMRTFDRNGKSELKKIANSDRPGQWN